MKHLTTLFVLGACAASMASGPKTIHFDECQIGDSVGMAYDALGVRFGRSSSGFVSIPGFEGSIAFGGSSPKYLHVRPNRSCAITFHVPGEDRPMGATSLRLRFAAFGRASVSLFDVNQRLIRSFVHSGNRQGIWVTSSTDGQDLAIGRIVIRSSSVGYAAIDDLTFCPGTRPAKLISGNVALEDRKSKGEVPLLLTIRPLDRPWETLERWIDQEGPFKVYFDIPSGDYEFLARGETWLQDLHPPVRIDHEGSPLLGFSLKNGDVNSDNEIDLGDYALVAQMLGKETCRLLDRRPDLNQDGRVDREDLEIVWRNFGLLGDE